MRLIDADACIDYIRNNNQHAWEALAYAPTIDAVEVVRCKDCRWWQDNNNGYPHANCHWCETETPDGDDFCSLGERKDKTKYPATYNTNTKCGGCVHLDELGRCLNFMLAKDDRSCWRGSWENNNGELAEQTERREK